MDESDLANHILAMVDPEAYSNVPRLIRAVPLTPGDCRVLLKGLRILFAENESTV